MGGYTHEHIHMPPTNTHTQMHTYDTHVIREAGDTAQQSEMLVAKA